MSTREHSPRGESKTLGVRFKVGDAARIEAVAAEQGVTTSDYLRDVVLSNLDTRDLSVTLHEAGREPVGYTLVHSEHEHVAGPWRAFVPDDRSGWSVHSAETLVASAWYEGPESDETRDTNEANARLIAAAPDLLAACDQSLTDLQGIANLSDDPSIQGIVQEIARNLGTALARAASEVPNE